MNNVLAGNKDMKKFYQTLRFTKRSNENSTNASANDTRVLLMEDDIIIQQLVLKVLAIAGYDALLVKDEPDAINVSENEILIVDVPRDDSHQNCRLSSIRHKNPETAILVTSSLPVSQIDFPILQDSKMKFLRKPYLLEELLGALTEWSGNLGN